MASFGGFDRDEDFGMPGYQNGLGGPAADGGRQPGGHPGPDRASSGAAADLESGGGEGSGGGPEGHESAVFIGNLQWWTTDVELETLCSEYGQVVNMRFIEDKACGKSRGMAVVEFGDHESAARCVNGLGGREINGRACRVNFQGQRGGGGGGTSHYAGGGGAGQAGRGVPGPPGSSSIGGGRGVQGGLVGRGSGRGMGIPGRGVGPGMPGRGPGGMVPMDDFPGPMMGDMMGMAGMMGLPGMMGMGPMGMDMMAMQMMGGPGMMPPFGMPGGGMPGGGMPGMGFKPPPPPGPPPKKEES